MRIPLYVITLLSGVTLCCVGCGGGKSPTPPAPAVSVSITPSSSNLLVRTTAKFQAAVTGHTNTNVTFAVVEGSSGGQILNSGDYVAPQRPGTYTVRAISQGDPSRFADATVYVHDYRNTVSAIPRVADGYDYHTASLLADGTVLIVGGHGFVDLVHKQSLRYVPSTRSFQPDASLAVARMAHVAFTLPDGKVVVAGGYNLYGGSTAFDPAFKSSEIFDPVAKTFSGGPDMNFPRRNHVATQLKDSRVLVTGGIQLVGSGFGASPNTEIYDPALNRFVAANRMNDGRWMHTATLLTDGRVLITGGRNNNCTANCQMYSLNSAEIFDPATGSYTPTGFMHYSRYNHTATLLSDGRVLILGGESTEDLGTGNDQVGVAEVYDPSTGQFTTWTSLIVPRSSHQATLLNNGLLWVTGGFKVSGFPTERTEFFNPQTGESVEGPLLTDNHVRHTSTRFSNGEVLIFAGWNGAQPGSYGETLQ
jgi:hypothetical protein